MRKEHKGDVKMKDGKHKLDEWGDAYARGYKKALAEVNAVLDEITAENGWMHIIADAENKEGYGTDGFNDFINKEIKARLE
jgi:hypothetical protein